MQDDDDDLASEAYLDTTEDDKKRFFEALEAAGVKPTFEVDDNQNEKEDDTELLGSIHDLTSQMEEALSNLPPIAKDFDSINSFDEPSHHAKYAPPPTNVHVQENYSSASFESFSGSGPHDSSGKSQKQGSQESSNVQEQSRISHSESNAVFGTGMIVKSTEPVNISAVGDVLEDLETEALSTSIITAEILSQSVPVKSDTLPSHFGQALEDDSESVRVNSIYELPIAPSVALTSEEVEEEQITESALEINSFDESVLQNSEIVKPLIAAPEHDERPLLETDQLLESLIESEKMIAQESSLEDSSLRMQDSISVAEVAKPTQDSFSSPTKGLEELISEIENTPFDEIPLRRPASVASEVKSSPVKKRDLSAPVGNKDLTRRSGSGTVGTISSRRTPGSPSQARRVPVTPKSASNLKSPQSLGRTKRIEPLKSTTPKKDISRTGSKDGPLAVIEPSNGTVATLPIKDQDPRLLNLQENDRLRAQELQALAVTLQEVELRMEDLSEELDAKTRENETLKEEITLLETILEKEQENSRKLLTKAGGHTQANAGQLRKEIEEQERLIHGVTLNAGNLKSHIASTNWKTSV